MTATTYRLESAVPMVGRLLPLEGLTALGLHCRAAAIVLAAKSGTRPFGQEIRVVHLPSGEVVYRKTAALPALGCDEAW